MFGTIWGSVHLLCHGDVALDDLCLALSEMELVLQMKTATSVAQNASRVP